MALTIKKGCLIEGFEAGEVEAIGHQANCQNTMNSGVAKALRVKWPQVYEADCQTIKGDRDKLGSLSMTLCEHGPIFNLYGQYIYGYDRSVQYTDLDALDKALGVMRLFIDAGEHKSVGFPKLGTDRGGAKWVDVEALIVKHFAGIDVTIYVK
jgi:O-acetyl-ADP-ribose deacetylase (regulator of RNase III)